MTVRLPFQKWMYHHVYNRGLNKQTLFFSEKDYVVFMRQLSLCKSHFKNVRVVSYCILPNHFHFVFECLEDGFGISQFMQRLCSYYARYLIEKYDLEKGKRVFEWRFRVKWLFDEEYLYKCLAYVNFNALKHKYVEDPQDWIYSSYRDFILREDNWKISFDWKQILEYKDCILEGIEY